MSIVFKRSNLILAWLIAAGISVLSGSARPMEIPIRVDVPEGITTGQWPVTFGVPFPKGVLTNAAEVVVSYVSPNPDLFFIPETK